MKILKTPEELRDSIREIKKQSGSLGLVPTMGALHRGHLSLIQQAKQVADIVIASIYVNPTQFAPQEDFSDYPRPLQNDLDKLTDAGCDLVFVPDDTLMYPHGFSTAIVPPAVALELEGQSRPTHFAGVCAVCLKLFNLSQADHAFFGLKDYQQFAVLRAMVKDLNVPIQLHGCPTIRESDGLALSSRNQYLTAQQRKIAPGIHRALETIQAEFTSGLIDAAKLEQQLNQNLRDNNIGDIHYATLRHATTLKPIAQASPGDIALIAARVGHTRLIDNWILR